MWTLEVRSSKWLPGVATFSAAPTDTVLCELTATKLLCSHVYGSTMLAVKKVEEAGLRDGGDSRQLAMAFTWQGFIDVLCRRAQI